jgi:signal transduction histidine kinase
MTTDAERLRIALVNMLVNARHAVLAREESLAAAERSSPLAAETTGLTAAPGARTSSDPFVATAAAVPPAITLRTERRETRFAIIIDDRGTGIDSADRMRVFDPYFTTRRGGTGLGLAIAKNIVEGLRGTIAVTSVLGVGTTIDIDLPGDAATTHPDRANGHQS